MAENSWELIISEREARVSFSAVLSDTMKVVEAFADFLEDRKCPIDFFAFKLIMQELLVNAVVHGSQNNSSKKVNVYVGFNEFRLAIEISDEGEEKDKEMTQTSNQTFTEGGRGFQMMEAYGYYVDVLSSGKGFILSKRLGEGL